MQAAQESRALVFPFVDLSLPMDDQFLIRYALRKFDGDFPLVIFNVSLSRRYLFTKFLVSAHTVPR
jgi:hypothetical protein